jgi:DNA-binding MarR family transcriptional regulator
VARRAWRHLFQFLMATAVHRERVLEGLSLTPNEAKALGALALETAPPMSELARLWRTDAPNATWVVNRLETRGLVKRVMDAKDRRIKRVVLTKRGAATRNTLLKAFYEPPPELMALGAADLAALVSIGAKLALAIGAPHSEDAS